ncbi:MAG: hypothetical protein AAF585_29395, partial [Verrucomicrobiota bacterium]
IRDALLENPPGISYEAPRGEGVADPNTLPKLIPEDADDSVRYAVRFVYERPKCFESFEDRLKDNSGAKEALRAHLADHEHYRPVLSAPTEQFVLASFFDPDAPQRPLRITMPVDTSITGLRKFPRNVSFLLSKQLRKQMQSAGKKVTDIGGGDARGIDIGVLCSLSLPIITIVALMLLMVFVFVLNIVFWWLPFFRICFPLKLSK